MRARKLTTEVRREQIVQAALDLVAAGGLRALNTADLARRVGFVPSAIYRHFDGLDPVLDAVVDHLADRLHRNVQAVAAQTADPLEQLRRLLLLHVRMLRQNQAIPRMIFSEDFYAGRPQRKARIRAAITSYLGQIAAIARRGRRIGRIRAALDPGTIAVMFLGVFQPAGVLWFVSDGRFDAMGHVRRAWNVFRRGIEADAAAGRTR